MSTVNFSIIYLIFLDKSKLSGLILYDLRPTSVEAASRGQRNRKYFFNLMWRTF